jgi:hypothetical protein
MAILFLILVILAAVPLFFFWKEWQLFNNTQTELLYKTMALADYENWRKEIIQSLSKNFSDVEVNGLGLKYDKQTKDCLIARRYKHRVESEEGRENEIVWQIRDLKTGEKIDDVFWGTALPNATPDDGDRKKSTDQIKHDMEEKKRADKLLRDFKFIWD